MDWKQFFAQIIGSLAWPAVLGAVVFFLRKELPNLLRNIKSATVAGNKLEFGDALRRGEDEAEVISSDLPQTDIPIYFLSEEKMQLAQSFPAAAVLAGYKEVERTLLEIRGALGLPPHTNLGVVVKKIIEEQGVEPEAEPLFRSFREARNAAVHADKSADAITPAGALQYFGQARLLKSIFDKVLERIAQKN